MKPVRIAVLLAVVLSLGAFCVSAQPVISAKSGVIAYVEGQVFMGDQPVEYSITKFPDMKENSVVRTEDGRAEILLTPGVVLRLGEKSSLKLITNRLIDTRLELLTGSAVVEADDIAKDNNVTIVCKNGTVALSKAGIYRFDTVPARVKVFKGLADVQIGGETTPVGAARMAMLDGTSASVQKFNAEETDALDHWSHRRGEYLAIANVSAAKSLLDSGKYSPSIGLGLGGYGMGMNNCMNAWAFNQWYGMYTYMPCRGSLYSPYGYRFWSPYTVSRAYYVPPTYYGGNRNGGTGIGSGGSYFPSAASTSTGYSGVSSSAGSYGGGTSGGFSGGAGGVSAGGGGGVSSAGGAGGGGHGGSSGGGGGGGRH